jgi:hypothetical protein
MTFIESEFELGQEVYLKTDEDQKKRLIVQISISLKGINYNLMCGTVSSWHFDFEISTEANILTKMDVNKNAKS